MPPPGVCMNIFSTRNKKNGYGTVIKPERFLNQDFQELKEYCLTTRQRFVDVRFPPDSNSIGQTLLEPSVLAQVEWLRPTIIVSNPSLVVDGVSRFDFGQGAVGNCWFLASIGALTFRKEIFEQVVPLDQKFSEDYCGIFHFRFWRFGKWVDVVIDDKLPTINGELIFVHCQDRTEFWPALLEKAYAKVCGSYSDMHAGTLAEAMMDFTGGFHMHVDLSQPRSDLFELMFKAGESRSLMGCGTYQDTSENTGLVQGHAYTVTGVKKIISREKLVSLVRLWNPWRKREWKGDWSDNSPLWQTVSPQDRQMCLRVDDDGEFWMTLEDFCKFYVTLDICSMTPDFLEGSSFGQWKTSFYEGRWVAGTTAGGCTKYPQSFWTNPQYRVKIDKSPDEQGEKNIYVTLVQMPDKRHRCLVQNLHIGFYVFEVTEENNSEKGKFLASFFKTPVAQTKCHRNGREVMEVLMLKPGEYLIVPCTVNPNETGSFILMIHSKEETSILDNSNSYQNYNEEVEEPVSPRSGPDDGNKRDIFRQHCDKYEEVDAEQLQGLLNEHILKGDLKAGGFSIDACRSMIALMDASVTGKLNGKEFVHLWKKVIKYKDIFYRSDVSHTGTLSLSELRNAIMASGLGIADNMLNLIALRYGNTSGQITLENFISLILRFECMHLIFTHLSNGSAMNLQKYEWLNLSMYT